MADVKQVIINVLEQNMFAATKPMQTVRTFSLDFSPDTFTCSSCGNEVVITHWEYERGLWPDVDLPCEKCGKHWSILK